MLTEQQARERAAIFQSDFFNLRAEVAKAIVGHSEIVDGILTCLFCGGHALLEGVPGIGKTLLIRTLSQAVQLSFSRVQFTPDLMPADITGTSIVAEKQQADGSRTREFVFQRGPVFAQMVLADEINRATPKTQAALLEAMAERSVTVGGTTHQLPLPFFVMATQPAGDIHSSGDAGKFATPLVNRFVRVGASPRAAQAIVLASKCRALIEGRFHVSAQDVRTVALAALRHRLLLNFEAAAEGVTTDAIVRNLIETTPSEG